MCCRARLKGERTSNTIVTQLCFGTPTTDGIENECHAICSCFVSPNLFMLRVETPTTNAKRHNNGTRNRWKAFIVTSHAQVFFPRLVFFLRQQKVSGDRTCLSPSPDGCQ